MATAPGTMLTATSVMPTLTVDDVPRSLAFFEALGFEVEERWEEKRALLGVMLKAGDVRIGLSQDDGKKGRDRVKGRASASISRSPAASTTSPPGSPPPASR